MPRDQFTQLKHRPKLYTIVVSRTKNAIKFFEVFFFFFYKNGMLVKVNIYKDVGDRD